MVVGGLIRRRAEGLEWHRDGRRGPSIDAVKHCDSNTLNSYGALQVGMPVVKRLVGVDFCRIGRTSVIDEEHRRRSTTQSMAPTREGAISGLSQRIILGYCAAPFAADVVKRPFFVGKDVGIFRIGLEIPIQYFTRINHNHSSALSQ